MIESNIMQKLTPRELAELSADTTYPMTKPCKRGHMGQRYTSCGICVQCAADRQTERHIEFKRKRAIANLKNYEPARVYTADVRPDVHDTMDILVRILEHGTPEQIENCAAFLEMINAQIISKPTQGVRGTTLTRLDLVRLVDVPAARMMDGGELVQGWDQANRVYVKLEGRWYLADELKNLWDKTRNVIRGKVTI